MRMERFFLASLLMGVAACEPNADIEGTIDTGGLTLEPGLMWAEKYKLEIDTEQGEISTSGEFTPDGSMSHDGEYTRAVRVSKVIAPTFVEAVGKHGYLVQTVENSSYSTLQDGLSNTVAEGLAWLSGRILVADRGWVRSFAASDSGGYTASDSSVYSASGDDNVGDNDVWQGDALYPVAPHAGAYYTSDDGSIFLGGGAKKILNADAVSLTQKFPIPVLTADMFYETCFAEMSSGGSKTVEFKSSCEDFVSWSGLKLPHLSNELWVGRGLTLKSTLRNEEIVATRVCCSHECEQIYPGMKTNFFGSCSESDPITLDGYRRSRTQTVEIVQFEKAANAMTQPKLSDIKVTLD